MIIEGNQKELDAMKEFHKGNRQEGLRLQEEFAAEFRENIKIRITAPVRKHAGITATARSAWRSKGTSGACPKLYETSSQQEDQASVRADRAFHRQRDRTAERGASKEFQ